MTIREHPDNGHYDDIEEIIVNSDGESSLIDANTLDGYPLSAFVLNEQLPHIINNSIHRSRRVSAPFINNITDGQTDVNTCLITKTPPVHGVGGSPFINNDTNLASDWILATDPDFTNIVDQVSNSVIHVEHWSPVLTNNTTYYVKARNIIGKERSAWSSVISFTTGSDVVVIEEPTFEIGDDDGLCPTTTIITMSGFNVLSGNSDYQQTQVIVTDIADNVNHYYTSTDENCGTVITLDDPIKTYRILATHIGTNGRSPYVGKLVRSGSKRVVAERLPVILDNHIRNTSIAYDDITGYLVIGTGITRTDTNPADDTYSNELYNKLTLINTKNNTVVASLVDTDLNITNPSVVFSHNGNSVRNCYIVGTPSQNMYKIDIDEFGTSSLTTITTPSNGITEPELVSTYDGKVYLVGRLNNKVYLWEVLSDNTFVSKAVLNKDISFSSFAYKNECIFLTTTVNSSDNTDFNSYGYDPITNTWNTLASPGVNSGSKHIGFGAKDGLVFLLDNFNDTGFTVSYYNYIVNSWGYSYISDLPYIYANKATACRGPNGTAMVLTWSEVTEECRSNSLYRISFRG